MEQMIIFKYITNLINLDFDGCKINQVEVIKNKFLAILLNYNTIILFDTKTEKYISNTFSDKVHRLNIYDDNLFIILGNTITLICFKDLSISKQWEINEKFYLFTIFEYNNFNFEMIYVNFDNELKFYSKGYLFDPKYKVMYKEEMGIDKLIYQSGMLIWNNGNTIKVFDIENKKMIFRKLFDLNKSIYIDFLLFDNFLCMNIDKNMIIIYKLFSKSNENITKPVEIFRIEDNINDYIGFWLNSALTKVSIVKSMKRDSLYHSKLEIYKIDDSKILHERVFNIFSYNTMNFSFSNKYSLVYLFDDSEIYHVTLTDKNTKVLDDLKLNVININLIYEGFAKFSNDEKLYIINKIARNMSLIRELQVDESKLIFFFNSVLGTINETFLNLICNILLNNGNFEHCFKWFNKFYTALSDKSNDKIIYHLLGVKNYELLSEYINIKQGFYLNRELKDYFSDETRNDDKLLYIYALANIKMKEFNKGISLLLSLNKYEEVYKIIKENHLYDLFFEFDNLLTSLKEDQVIEAIDRIFNNYTDFIKLGKFFDIVFTLLDEKKINNFVKNIVEKEKYYLLFDIEKTNMVLNVLLKIGDKDLILKLIKNFQKLDYKNIYETYSDLLHNNQEFTEVLINILNYLQEYSKIIDIYLNKLRDPEKCINFIENINISENNKQELISYFKSIIKNSDYLSSIKKFYYINIFQSSGIEDSELIAELSNSNDNEDLKIILLLLEQIKLKIRILNYAYDISSKTMINTLLELKKSNLKGKRLVALNKCDYTFCQHNKYIKGDNIACFINCLHSYHKLCLDKQFEDISLVECIKCKKDS